MRLDLVTACLEVLLPHTAAAAVQALATPLLQPYGFVLQPGAVGTSASAGSPSSCCSTASPAAAVPASPTAAAIAAAAAAAGLDEGRTSSSYDDLIQASSNPAALLGRLLENAPNLARVASSSRGSAGLASIPSPVMSPVKPSPLKPSSLLRPAAQLLPQLPAGAAAPAQEAQQQQEQVAITVAGPGQDTAAAAGGGGAAAAAVSAAAAAAPATESFKFSIEGMSCGSCVASIEAAVQQVRWGARHLGHLAVGSSKPCTQCFGKHSQELAAAVSVILSRWLGVLAAVRRAAGSSACASARLQQHAPAAKPGG